MQPNLCVIIPAYNAAKTIGAVVRGAAAHIPTVIVADDGSTDDTAAAAALAGGEVIRIPQNRGKGHALKVLFQAAEARGYESVISMDADGQHDPEDISNFMAAHRASPTRILVGTRMRDVQAIPKARFNSMHIARFFISLVANQFVEDTQCGYRLYPLSVVQSITLTSERYVTENEVLMKAGDMGQTITFVPVKTIYGDAGSHFRAVADVARITAYVMAYIEVKWLIEAVRSNHPNTYAPGGDVRDLIGRHRIANAVFQVLAVAIVLPLTTVLFGVYCLPLPLARTSRRNFASVRMLGRGFAPVAAATLALPLLLVVALISKVANLMGVESTLLNRFINAAYPDLWHRS